MVVFIMPAFKFEIRTQNVYCVQDFIQKVMLVEQDANKYLVIYRVYICFINSSPTTFTNILLCVYHVVVNIVP